MGKIIHRTLEQKIEYKLTSYILQKKEIIKGRGAQHNPHNRFFKQEYVREHEEALDLPDETGEGRTHFLPAYPKTIVNKVESPDVGMGYSLNPYQGCEHGCIYCYARNSHQYWGFSSGLDFERKIIVKRNSVELLKKKLDNPRWIAQPVVLSGNTDCYQPIERKLKITRSLLETFLEYKHPVGIITKNALVTRDLDILQKLAEDNLVRVSLSITTLNEDLRRMLEPRTASVKLRLKTVEDLSRAGIPVNVMMAPIIPGLNSHEIMPLVKEVTERGALSVGYTMVRLNGQIADVFENWIRQAMPDRADKVLNQISSAHGGKLNDSRWGTRMKGEGNFAKMVKDSFAIARSKYLSGKEYPEINCSLFKRPPKGQLDLFGPY